MKKIILFVLILFLGISVNAEGEATIKNIKVNGRECYCTSYECVIEVDTKTAKITYDLADTTATVDRASGFSVDLTGQLTVVKIVVTNNQGDDKIENTYNISITLHEKSSDVTLKSLKVNDDAITLLKDVFVYNYMAKYSDEEIVVDAILNDTNAKLTKEDKYSFPLDRSSQSIDFTVTAENGTNKNYRIVLMRGDKPNTFLKSLKVDHGNISFDKNTLEYSFNVDYSVNELIVEAIAESDDATVKIEKDSLVVGENTIKVIVTNDKATSEYVLLVTREENKDKSLANLKSIKIREYPKFDFEENVLDYTIKFREIPEKLNIEAKSLSSDGKVEIVGNEDLVDGSKIIIKNTLIEAVISREYTITIKLDDVKENSKLSIIISLIILIITMIVLFVLEIKERRNRRLSEITKILNLRRKKEKQKKDKESKKIEDDIDII